ncbi:MAG: M67 family metallopeptidase [Oscillospiraceae bacterium]|jgi:proteasome lid subunit RPN8/RPN11|nr:M67 family metallopeptidase [Oscillospiraceae bacterium]
MITLRQSDRDALAAYALDQLPNEACGLLAGTETDGVRRVERVYFLRNLDRSPEHFSLDPKEQFAALKDARAWGWRLLGNWHSHPATPARPSAEDIRLAFDPEASYLILSLAGAARTLKSFRVTQGEAREEPLEIVA